MNMAFNRKLKVSLTEHESGCHCLTWQDPMDSEAPPTVRIVTLQEIQSDFPEFCKAVSECHSDLNPTVHLDQLLMCAAYSYAETSMRIKRFQVYTHLAYAAGFVDRTELPEGVEEAVKATWHDEEEQCVGFKAN